jgi:uncharacterized protein YqcC (DUF446 family)
MMTKQGLHDKFFVLLAQMPGATKEALVWQYSDLLTTSLREFYAKKPEEYTRMIADMQLQVNNASKYSQVDPEKKRLRSSILLRLQKHGVDTTHWKNVNIFLLQPRIAGKMLFEMTVPEMKALIPKLESILKKDSHSRAEEIKLTELN